MKKKRWNPIFDRGWKKIFFIMRITVLFLFAGLLQVSASVYSQQTKLNLKTEKVSVTEILRMIEEQSDFHFLYRSDYFKGVPDVMVDLKDAKLEDVLNKVIVPYGFKYEIDDKTVVIKRSDPNAVTNPVAQQKKESSGTVKDSKGLPLPGVTVIVKGTTLGIITDNDGNFSFSLPSDAKILVFSFVGMKTQEITIAGMTTINVTMENETYGIEEVVVTGYGSQRKKDITGAVSVVDMNAFKSIPTGSTIQALQGQASGVTIITNGAPGAGSQIFIRGITSFGSVYPLILVDGLETYLDKVNLNEIESVQVLKDAGAAAIYGVRGSNGVIIVTTKRGKVGAPIITYDAYYGIKMPLSGNPYNLLNSADFAKLYKIAFPTSTLFANGLPDYLYAGPGVSGTGMEGDAAVDPSKYNFAIADPASNNYIIEKVNKTGTDWFHEVFKPAPMQQHNLTVSGGTDNSKYMFALGYLDEQGTLIETYNKRYSARLNTDFKIGKNIRIGENLYLFQVNNKGYNNMQEMSIMGDIYNEVPIIPVYDIKGNFGGTFAVPELSVGIAMNPVAVQKRTVNNRSDNWAMSGNVYAEVDLLKHVTARTSFGFEIDNRYNVNFGFNAYNERQQASGLTSLYEGAVYNKYSIWTNTLNYANTFGKHKLSVLAGSEAIDNSGRSVSGSSSNFYSTDFNYLELSNGNLNITNSSSANRNTLFSLFSRLDYSYNDKYLLGLTVRRDGSSLFGSNKRYGVFPSVSLGWRLSEEAFMKDVSWLNDLKIRGSYGVLGSQNNINPYSAFTLFNSYISASYYPIAGNNNSSQQGFYTYQNGNPNTGWEKDIISNVGFDATILNKKIELSAEYYKKSISGLLFRQPLPATAGGANAPIINIGDVQNTGFDISATYRGRLSNSLNFTIGANITSYKNEIVKIPGSAGYFDTSSSRNGNLVRNQQGHPISSYFGYDVVGLFQSDADVAASPTQTDAAPGRFKYRDLNGDGKITPDDRTFIGNANPDFTYGVNLGLNYKNFDFSAVIYGSQGNQVYNLVKYYTYFWGGWRGEKSNATLNAWTPENPTSTIPKVENNGGFSTSAVPNSFYVEDGSFLKLRSITLGYKIPPAVLDRYKIRGLRVYVQATNLFQITKYSGLDPELGGNSQDFGIDRGNYPNNEKSFIVGINLSF